MRLTTFAIFAALIGCSGPVVTRARDVAPARWGSTSVELVDEGGRVLPTFTHGGRTYVLGALGHRYFVRVRNGSGARIEVVASVDGRDVLDGAPAEWSKRGYLVDAYGTLTIDGYRLSQDAVAAFRFSSVPRSYAALEGDPRDVGVIGVAVFREREAPRAQRPVERELRSEAAPAPPRSAPARRGPVVERACTGPGGGEQATRPRDRVRRGARVPRAAGLLPARQRAAGRDPHAALRRPGRAARRRSRRRWTVPGGRAAELRRSVPAGHRVREAASRLVAGALSSRAAVHAPDTSRAVSLGARRPGQGSPRERFLDALVARPVQARKDVTLSSRTSDSPDGHRLLLKGAARDVPGGK